MKSTLFDSPLFANLPSPTQPHVSDASLGTRTQSNTQTLLGLDARFSEYIEREQSRLSTQTVYHYRQSYGVFRAFLAEGIDLSPEAFGKRLCDLDEYAIWHRNRGIAAITVNTYWRALRGFFRFLEEKHGFPNPYRTHRAPRFQAPPPKALAQADCQRILVAAANYPAWTALQRARAVAVLGIMLYAGLRKGEVIRLVNTDVDLAQGAIRVEKGKGPNGGKTRFVDISPDLHRILRAYLRERDRARSVAPEFFTLITGAKPISRSAIDQIIRRGAPCSSRRGMSSTRLSNAPLAWKEDSPSLVARPPHDPHPMRNTTHLEILVPTADNEGSTFPASSFEAFEHFLLDVAGGLSRRADVEGVWRAPSGETMRDRSRSYVVTVDDLHAERIASEIDTYIRRQFRQLASFIELVPTRATVF